MHVSTSKQKPYDVGRVMFGVCVCVCVPVRSRKDTQSSISQWEKIYSHAHLNLFAMPHFVCVCESRWRPVVFVLLQVYGVTADRWAKWLRLI